MKTVLRRPTKLYHRPRVVTVRASRINSTADATRITSPCLAAETTIFVTIKFIEMGKPSTHSQADKGSPPPAVNEAPSLIRCLDHGWVRKPADRTAAQSIMWRGTSA